MDNYDIGTRLLCGTIIAHGQILKKHATIGKVLVHVLNDF